MARRDGRSLVARAGVALARSASVAASADRLLLAAKTAIAVGAAWALARFMPGVTDQYPFYAPLGALLSMYPTLMDSVRTGLQTLGGLVVGIGLAGLVVLTVGPSWWSIPVVVAVGVIISGTGWFGAGQEYIPIAALFVLLIGGQNADAYSLGYATQMALGVGVGFVVNVVIAPRTLTAWADARLVSFQQRLADHLHRIAEALTESWPPAHAAWADSTHDLADTLRDVRGALAEADRSRKGNVRALVHRRTTRVDHERLEMLGRVVVRIQDISDALADTIWRRPGAIALDRVLIEPLSAACHAVADALEPDASDAADVHDRRGRAAHAVRDLLEAVRGRSDSGSIAGPGVLAVMQLRRILVAVTETRPLVA